MASTEIQASEYLEIHLSNSLENANFLTNTVSTDIYNHTLDVNNGGKEERTALITNKILHYRDAWERNPIFAKWLTKGRNSRRARCVACKLEMTADVSVLKNHSLSIKHLKNMKTFLAKIKTKPVLSATNEENIRVNKNNEIKHSRFYVKGFYCPRWESDKRFKNWIKPGKSSRYAYCRKCSIDIIAELTYLKRHNSSTEHKQKSENSESIKIECNFCDEDSPVVLEIVNDAVTSCPTPSHSTRQKCERRRYSSEYSNDPRERLATVIGMFLLKGHKMLNAACTKCECVLLKDRRGIVHCYGCQYGFAEEFGHTAVLQKKPKSRKLAADSSIDDNCELKEEVYIKEEPADDHTEIVINEDTSAEVYPRIQNKLVQERYSPDFLRNRVTRLTKQLQSGRDIDQCLDELDTVVRDFENAKKQALSDEVT